MSRELPTPSDLRRAARWYSGPRLWATLSRVLRFAGEKTALSSLTLFYCLKDSDTPAWAKSIIVGTLGYVILPVDLIPDLIPVAGYTDDLGAIIAALGTVAAYIKDEHKARATAQINRLLGRPDSAPPPEFRE